MIDESDKLPENEEADRLRVRVTELSTWTKDLERELEELRREALYWRRRALGDGPALAAIRAGWRPNTEKPHVESR